MTIEVLLLSMMIDDEIRADKYNPQDFDFS
jgi:hypothetical protein